MTLAATATKRFTSPLSVPSAVIHANGGTNRGAMPPHMTLAAVPMTAPVGIVVLIAVFTWSAMIAPKHIPPVSTGVPRIGTRTFPYVFFKSEFVVPAPRLTQLPT